jgi:hypothetical protein
MTIDIDTLITNLRDRIETVEGMFEETEWREGYTDALYDLIRKLEAVKKAWSVSS